MRKSSSKRRSIKRRSIKRRSHQRFCKVSRDIEAIIKLNAIKWDITNPLETASTSINDYFTNAWCSREIKLLLPITIVSMSSKMSIYYQIIIRKSAITFWDILYTIWKFYHMEKVNLQDLTYIAMSDNSFDVGKDILEKYQYDHKTIRNVRFILFLKNQTQFSGLVHQRDNIYSLNLS